MTRFDVALLVGTALAAAGLAALLLAAVVRRRRVDGPTSPREAEPLDETFANAPPEPAAGPPAR